MKWLRSFRERVRGLFSKGGMDAEMDEEIRFHIEQETEKNLRAGMGPSEARRKAILAFGGVERAREQTREGRGVAPLENLFRDLLFAFRSLRKVPGVVVVTVLSLGLGIAVSSIVFAVANGFLFGDPGPIRDPSTLLVVYSSEPDGRLYGETSFPDYLDMAAQTQVLEELTAHRVGVLSVGDPALRDRVIVELVTGEYFRALGTQPALGRGFLPEETVPGRAERVVVLSHSTWMDRYGGDPGVLGERVTLDGFPFTIIGVAPEGLKGRFFGFEVDGWLPLGIPGGTYRATPERMVDRASRQFLIVGRLAPGRTLEEAQAEFSLMASRFHETHGEIWEDQNGRPRSITVLSDKEARVPPDGRTALLGTAGFLLGGALLILLLACTNVASLLLARAHRRARELAVRTSLGASRGRLLRLLLSESLVLALLGGALGLYLTALATRFLGAVPFPMDVPLRFEFHVDHRVVLFTLILAMGAAVVAGMGPALQGSRADLTLALKNDAGRFMRRSRRFTLRNFLVVVQVFAALTLLVGAGLAIRSMRASADFDPGLDPDRVAVVWKEPPPEEMEPEDLREYFQELGDRIAAEAEVEAVALARVAEAHPFMEGFATALVERGEGEPLRIRFNAVTPGYMEMLSIPLARGRSIGPGDVEGSLPVAVVNQAFVERFLQGTPGVGEGFTVRSFFDSERVQERSPVTFQVVGVVAPRDPGLGSGDRPFFWTSFLQDEPVRGIIHAKGRSSAEALVPILRREVPSSPGEFTFIEPAPYRDYVDYRFLGHRIVSRALGFSGAFALILAVIGVYGIVSFTVSHRLREMAIRQAVGARRAQVVRSAVASGLRPTMVGVVLGLLVVVPLAFLVRSALLGVMPLDPIAVGGGTILLITASALAGLVPARRLLSTEPMETLREE
jgi:predicted permease